jgi:maltose/moltooligosaccharide transporter
MVCYWQYVVHAIARGLFGTSDSASAGFREAVLVNGQAGGFYNAVACIAAFAMVPFTRRFGAGRVHALCLTLGGLGMLALPAMPDRWWLFLPMVGVGLAWGSIMGNPYVMLARSIPPERTGVYMGIFNMFIVVPMLIQSFTLPLFYGPLLGNDPRHVVMLGGALLLCAAVATLRVKVPQPSAA